MSGISQQVRKARDSLHSRLFRRQWNCAIIERPIAVVAGLLGPDAQAEALASTIWLPEPRGGYIADPFGYRTASGDYRILAELFDWKRQIGSIVSCRFDGKRFSPYETLLDGPSHLSYPFIIRHGDQTLVIPENSAARRLSAFTMTAAGKATSPRPVIADQPLVDASIIVRDGKYWLFAVENDRYWNAELSLHVADDLFGEWRPHPHNPVKVDIASGRPAGTLFEHEGQLYRPAQDCSQDYGGQVVINRVTDLSMTGFTEEPVATVSPHGLRRYDRGLHTISAMGDFTLIDAARKMPIFWPG